MAFRRRHHIGSHRAYWTAFKRNRYHCRHHYRHGDLKILTLGLLLPIKFLSFLVDDTFKINKVYDLDMKVSDMNTKTKLDGTFSQLPVRSIKLTMYRNRPNVYPLFPKYIGKKLNQ